MSIDSAYIRIPAIVLMALTAIFCASILWYHFPAPSIVNAILVFGWLFFVGVAALAFNRGDHRGIAIFAAAFAGFIIWFALIAPSNDRTWSPEMAETLTYSRDGDTITLKNVRNFDWTGPEAANEKWETRTYDLNALQAVDVLSLYWKGDSIAHTYFSFVWKDGEALSLSVEIRKEKGEAYSPFAGFFKAYELAILAGDERDFYGWRVHYPKEDIQIFRTRATPEEARTLLIKLLDFANEIAKEPTFYNTLTDNCTTEVWMLTDTLGKGKPLDWRIFSSGYLPDALYDLAILDTSRPLQTLRDEGHILPRAREAMDKGLTGAAFSRALRSSQR
jgi:hypothetical protein